MAYRSVLILCAEGVVIDTDSNLVSAFNLLEEIVPAGFPFLLPRLSVLSSVERDMNDPAIPAGCSIRFQLDDEVIFQVASEVNFADRPRSRYRLVLAGLVIPRPGKLRVAALIGDEVIHSCDVTVRPAVNPPAPVPAPAGAAG
jgi:hypothetical protein